jgi:cell division septum initiation protein DivIVA
LAYRSHETDEDAVKDLLEDLQDKNINVRQWVEFQEEKLQETESSAENVSSAQRQWRRKWKVTFCDFKHN